VIATLQGKSRENYFCDVGDGDTYVLNGMNIEGATQKNRPYLNVGAVLDTRVPCFWVVRSPKTNDY
jgi:hypothetical protein